MIERNGEKSNKDGVLFGMGFTLGPKKGPDSGCQLTKLLLPTPSMSSL